MVNSLRWLGSALLDEGKTVEAIAVAKRAVEVADRYPIEVNEKTRAYAYQGLANVLVYTKSPGQLEIAQRSYALSKAINKGRVTPAVLSTRAMLVNAYRYEERFQEAITEGKEVVAEFANILGPRHPSVATAMLYLAASQAARGELVAALANFRDSLTITTETDGQEPTIRRAIGHVNVASALASMRQHENAIRELRIAMELFEKGVGSKHPRAQAAVAALAQSLLYVGQLKEAEQILESLVAVSGKSPDLELRVQCALSMLSMRQGRYQDAAKFRQQRYRDERQHG